MNDIATAAQPIGSLRYLDLKPAADLARLFARLDHLLHQAGHAREERYTIALKVLLVKILDERTERLRGGRMILQDFSDRAYSDEEVTRGFVRALQGALATYGQIVPNSTSAEMGCSAHSLREISKIVAPINLLGSSPQVIQDFFMYFARFFYKIDLAQYFTPYDVTHFVAQILNPGRGDRVIDPACGTADFLIAAKRVAADRHGVDLSTALTGVEISETAANLSRFNLLLHGAPDAHVSCRDSLTALHDHENQYTVALCNPPFGTRVVETRPEVLAQFELGTQDEVGRRIPLKSQETGLLFVEACMRAVVPGGRVGIILPNGYLGNRSARYVGFRRWLLCNARLAVVIGFPRFTFRKSGADVSASIVVAERRHKRLSNVSEPGSHPIHFNLLESVGWDLQSKRAARLYKRDSRDGSFLRGADGELISDADFDRVLGELYAFSPLLETFPWLTNGWRKHEPTVRITAEQLVCSLLLY